MLRPYWDCAPYLFRYPGEKSGEAFGSKINDLSDKLSPECFAPTGIVPHIHSDQLINLANAHLAY